MVFLVGKPLNEKRPKEMHMPKKRTPLGTVSGIISKDYMRMWKNPVASKVIFLGKNNLEKLRGYKAYLDL